MQNFAGLQLWRDSEWVASEASLPRVLTKIGDMSSKWNHANVYKRMSLLNLLTYSWMITMFMIDCLNLLHISWGKGGCPSYPPLNGAPRIFSKVSSNREFGNCKPTENVIKRIIDRQEFKCSIRPSKIQTRAKKPVYLFFFLVLWVW